MYINYNFPINSDIKRPFLNNHNYHIPSNTIIDNPDSENNPSSSLISSFAFLLVTLTASVICLSFIKNSFNYFTGRSKVKRTVQCTRISVISESGSIKTCPNTGKFLSINKFRQHYKDIMSDSFYKLSLEFESLKPDELMPCLEGDKVKNRGKNRFVNILPFDHSRVILTSPETEADDSSSRNSFSDYINANYVSGYYSSLDDKREEHEYIATQGPLQNTVKDFWRMVWQSGSKCIVMLTRFMDKDREKCHRYWPSSPSSNSEMYSDLQIEVISERVEAYKKDSQHQWIISEFKLTSKDGEERKLRHYQFQSWPDFESIEPPEALIHFVREVRAFAPYPTTNGSKALTRPIIIHCSAGVGRTGTFIGVDIVLNQIKIRKCINIPAIVRQMRNQRVWMVQTEQQYICIYKCAMGILTEIEEAANKKQFHKLQNGEETIHSDSKDEDEK